MKRLDEKRYFDENNSDKIKTRSVLIGRHDYTAIEKLPQSDHINRTITHKQKDGSIYKLDYSSRI